MKSKNNVQQNPESVGIIMDGNGRWAIKNQLNDRSNGHKAGLKNIESICEFSIKHKIKFLTLFAFSTENNSRPKKEVEFLIQILVDSIEYYEKFLLENKIKFKFIGDRSILNDKIYEKIQKLEDETFIDNYTLSLNIAFNYGGRKEILSAVNKIIESNIKKKISEEEFRKYLYNPDLKDPDLIIRTGGFQRLSNFLMFQSAYSELYFSEELWPDFSEESLIKAINFFKKQKRNFGLIDY